MTPRPRPRATFFRVIEAQDKAAALAEAIADPASPLRFEVDPAGFGAIPGTPFAYWAGDDLRALFRELPPFESEGRTARVGLQTSDDFRFVRLWTEVPPGSIAGAPRPDGAQRAPGRKDDSIERRLPLREQRWFPFAKGGKFSPFYADVYLVLQYGNGEGALEAFAHSVIRNPRFYFRPGLTWPRRSQKGLALRPMPAGCTFGDKGPTAFFEDNAEGELLALLAITNSWPFRSLVQLQMAFGSYEVGVIQRTPVPLLDCGLRRALAALAHREWSLKRGLDTAVETSHAFEGPALLRGEGWEGAGASQQSTMDAGKSAENQPAGFAERAARWSAHVRKVQAELEAIQREIDDICFDLYGISAEDRRAIERGFSVAVETTEMESTAKDGPEPGDAPPEETEALVRELLSWTLGVAFGRFDVRLATGERRPPPEPGPFDPLPRSSPGMLADGRGMPLDRPPAGYPIVFPEDGVLVDDPGHGSDLSARIREVFTLVFADQADAFWAEASEILAPQNGDLRSWFSRAFFEDHIKRYSRSHRKAPIYWQLSTPSGSYSVWLYYHRFTRDTLYRVLNDYVAPKLAHEARKLTSLIQEAGSNPRAAQRREIQAQEAFVEELRAFRDELARVAPLWNPNLDDGVIINFAPLWRLVPRHRSWQRERKRVWDRLLAGDYDWAHLAMRLWPERVVPRCAEDPSLAIAHGLQDLLWERGEDGKWRRRLVSKDLLERLIEERSSPAVKAALEELCRAPAPAGSSRGRRSGARRRRSPAVEPRGGGRPGRRALDPRTLEAVKQAIAAAGDGAGKSAVVRETGIDEAEWAAAIRELLARGVVSKTGSGRGVRYRLADGGGRE